MAEIREGQLESLTPILYVSDFAASVRYYEEKLGFKKIWNWGDPPTFGCVRRDGIELFFSQGGQGQPGTWMSIFVADADQLHAEMSANGAKISEIPADYPWGLREFRVQDPDGHTFRFGSRVKESKDLKIERTVVEARLEKRLAAVLEGLARQTNRTVGEVLEETLLHTFEPVPGYEGCAVASPHGKGTFPLIDQLKKQHGLDYDTHANYRFTEE